MMPLPFPPQSLIDALYGYLAQMLPPEARSLLTRICEAHRTNGSNPVDDLYRQLVPLLTPDMRAALTMICNAHAAGGVSPSMATTQFPPSTNPNNLPAPYQPPNGGCGGGCSGGACPMPAPGGGGGGCGCGPKNPGPVWPQQPPQAGCLPPTPVPAPVPFSNGCRIPPAVAPTPLINPASNPVVNATGTVNCQWYDPTLTDCEIKHIKETEKENTASLTALQTAVGIYEADIPAVGVQSWLCVTAFRIFSSDKSIEYTDQVGKIELKQVKQVQSPQGESLLVYGSISGASGRRLTVTEGRCQCKDLCACQIATIVMRLVIEVTPDGAPEDLLIEYDYERAWNDDNCMQCFPCGIPMQCGEDAYEPL